MRNSPMLSPSYCLLCRVTQRWSVLWYFSNIFVASLQCYHLKVFLKPFLLFFRIFLCTNSVPTPDVQHCFVRVMHDTVFDCSLLSCLNNIPLYSSSVETKFYYFQFLVLLNHNAITILASYLMVPKCVYFYRAQY